MAQKAFIKKMFTDIAGDYDRLNRIISFNLDIRWRKKAAGHLNESKTILDICAGTGDMAVAITNNCPEVRQVFLVDLSFEMLKRAREKLSRKSGEAEFHYVVADGEHLPFRNNFFDGVTMGFGLRNLDNIPGILYELDAVTRVNSKMVFLDISHPEVKIIAKFFYYYFYKFVPFYAKFLTGKDYAYRYLPVSLMAFYSQKEFVRIIRECGFRNVSYHNILAGICVIYSIQK